MVKKNLMIVNSIYQLLNVLNLKYNSIRYEEGDLIITDVTPILKTYIDRLKQSGLFRKVIYCKTIEINKEYGNAKEPKMSECFGNVDSFLRYIVPEELDNYDTIFFANYDVFIRLLACKYYHTACKFVAYEDGFSSYVIDFLRTDRAIINKHKEASKIKNKVKEVYLYEPKLSMRNDTLINKQLPKINRKDKEFVNMLNYVFGYEKIDNKICYIFLEQSFRAEGIKGNDIELMKECSVASNNRMIIKPHPRNKTSISEYVGVSSRNIGNVPWELFLINENLKDTTVITVCSNAALTSRILLGVQINTIMLYELYNGKVLWKEDEVLRKYLKKFKNQFSGENYYVPKTIYELRNTIKYLGEKHE